MNYTTVPRTWEKVNIWTHRIPVHYKARPSAALLSHASVRLSIGGHPASFAAAHQLSQLLHNAPAEPLQVDNFFILKEVEAPMC